MKLSIHYTPKMVAYADSYSPSAGKPAQVMASWAELGLPLDIVEPSPVSVEQFSLAHDRAFVEGILSGKHDNGFGNTLPSVAASLPYTSGVMLSAARAALENQRGAIAPCSGFHHAGYDFAGGFCTFNGLMVTAAVLMAEGKVRKIGILDCDQHWGNGTQDIIDRLHLGDRVVHYTPCGTFGRTQRAEAFLAILPQLLTTFADCDLVLYQAGADPHINDPLGGWLTTEQLYRRDAIIFDHLRKMCIPVAWNLAGGYQRDAAGTIRPVLTIHDNTLLAFAESWEVAATNNESHESVLSA